MATNGSQRRVFLTGATGAIGLPATRALVAAGHVVLGVARSEEGAAVLRSLGATPVRVDLFDPAAVLTATRDANVIAHFATKIPQGADARRPEAWEENDRLRRDSARILIAAAEMHGIRRFIFESIALAYPHRGEQWIDESVALQPLLPQMRSAVDAEALLQEFGRRGGEPVILRYPHLYGPGRASSGLLAAVAAGRMPVVGAGDNFISSVHVDDAGASLVAALTVAPGVYNVGDDQPLCLRDYMTAVARALDAPPPPGLALTDARTLMGEFATVLAASQRIANTRFRTATGWRPRVPSALDGWPDVVRRHAERTSLPEAPASAEAAS